MKKQIVAATMAVTVLGSVWFMQPTQPHHYLSHTVVYGETLEGIVTNANKNSDVNYDLREAIATSVAESAKMEGGATSRAIKVGDKVAIPIYRR